ncbi:glycosyltransferase [Methyloparacoccus murrellii]
MLPLSLSFLVSMLLVLMLLRYQHLHHPYSADHDLAGVQKYHTRPVPRIGGLGIVLGMGAGYWGTVTGTNPPLSESAMLLLAAAGPAFLAGLAEDLTKRVGVRQRLFATVVSAALGGWLLGGWLSRLDIPWLDAVLREPALSLNWDYVKIAGYISISLTCLAVAGVANAFNLIDGYNGLAGVVAIIILLGLAYVAHQVDDPFVKNSALALVGAIAGFLIWNYPRGLIFLGDGGAYFIGFAIAELSILLVAHHPQVSPWFPLLLAFYPIFETLFTIYRRGIHQRRNPGLPDAAHLHQLIYRIVVRWAVGSDHEHHQTQRNALTSPYLWFLSSLAVMPAVLFWDRTPLLQAFTLVFAGTYILLYRCIARRAIPSWMILGRGERKGLGRLLEEVPRENRQPGRSRFDQV